MGILSNIKQIFSGQEGSHTKQADTDYQELSPSFYIGTIEASRVEKDRFFRSSPYSPLADRANFSGLDYYPPDPNLRLTLPLQRAENPEPLTFQTSTGDERVYYRLGTVEFEVEGETAKLAIYKSDDHDELFLPFHDATSGKETYGAGRYLEPEELPGDKVLVDFNLAYNPYCAYVDDYSCPLPPFENHLKIPIRAGEKAYKK